MKQFSVPIVVFALLACDGPGEPAKGRPLQADETDPSTPSGISNSSDSTDPSEASDAHHESESTVEADDTEASEELSDVTDASDASDRSEDTHIDESTETADVESTVRFEVDMRCVEATFSTVYVTGPFVNWCGNCAPLTDVNNDGIWTTDYTFDSGTTVEYKYTMDNWSAQEDLVDDMTGGASCAPVTDFLNFANRILTTGAGGDTVLIRDTYGSCDNCDIEPVEPESLCGDEPGRVAPIVVSERQILDNGVPLHLKGVAWAPTPIGYGPGDYYAQSVEDDALIMAAAGINAVRTYGPILNREVLDILWEHGIYVMMTVYYGYSETAASAAASICAVKDHPAIIGWVVGNEWNYTNLAQPISLSEAVTKVGIIIDAIKANDASRPASTIYGGMPSNEILASLPQVDIWGSNHYPGESFGDFFELWQSRSSKPLYFGEYGSDAYDARIGAENETMQADLVESLTREIHENASINNRGSCIGGFIFEFNDEWWKYSDGSWSEHDTAPSWTNEAYPDSEIQEEWWGIVEINRAPREAYYRIQQMNPPTLE